ncbi:MAG TPA: hypothetical protein VKA68_11235 [bacterium]|nr:hypothetical protein [bacterium]
MVGANPWAILQLRPKQRGSTQDDSPHVAAFAHMHRFGRMMLADAD